MMLRKDMHSQHAVGLFIYEKTQKQGHRIRNFNRIHKPSRTPPSTIQFDTHSSPCTHLVPCRVVHAVLLQNHRLGWVFGLQEGVDVAVGLRGFHFRLVQLPEELVRHRLEQMRVKRSMRENKDCVGGRLRIQASA